MVRIPIGFDGIYVDDEGLTHLYSLDGLSSMEQYMNYTACNKALVLGCDDNGDSIEPDSPIYEP